MLLQLSFVLVLTLFYGVLAQVPFPNQCPEVNVKDPFDLDAYMGIWYEYSKYPFVFEIGKRCMWARYENLGNNTISVVNTAINRFTGYQTNVTGKAKVLGPGQLAVMFSTKQPADKPNYLVLGTDYTSYALVYSCTNFTTFAHTEIVWILTRERKPSAETVEAAKKVMDDNKLSQSFLIDTAQDNCPEPNPTTSTTTTTNEADVTITVSDPEVVAALSADSLGQEQPNVIERA